MKTTALILLVAYALALVVSTHIPAPPEVLVPKISDKWLHLIVYAGLAFLVCLNGSLRRAMGWRQCAAIIGFLAAFAALDEVTQIPFNRTCDPWDWVADMIGTLAAMAVFMAAAALYRLRRGDGPLGHENPAN
jgi:VanZ family protein